MDHKVSAKMCSLGVVGFSSEESIGLGKQKVQVTVREVEELPVSAGSPVPGHLSQVSAYGHRGLNMSGQLME